MKRAKRKILLISFLPLLFLGLWNLCASNARAAVLMADDATKTGETAAQDESGTEDHLAKIFDFGGTVQILKKGARAWSSVKKNMTIEAGDKVMTSEASQADVAYDAAYLNITHIRENTVAEFRSIEPTDVYLEDGTLFNALDGFTGEGQYQVSTPVYVAGVRGTHFDVSYDKTTEKFSASTIPDESGSQTSKVAVWDRKEGAQKAVEIISGMQMDLKRGEKPAQQKIRSVDPERMQKARDTFNQFRGRVDGFDKMREKGRQQMEQRRQNPDQKERQGRQPGEWSRKSENQPNGSRANPAGNQPGRLGEGSAEGRPKGEGNQPVLGRDMKKQGSLEQGAGQEMLKRKQQETNSMQPSRSAQEKRMERRAEIQQAAGRRRNRS